MAATAMAMRWCILLGEDGPQTARIPMTAEQIKNLPEWLLDSISWLALGGWIYWAFLIVGGGSLVLLLVGIFNSAQKGGHDE